MYTIYNERTPTRESLLYFLHKIDPDNGNMIVQKVTDFVTKRPTDFEWMHFDIAVAIETSQSETIARLPELPPVISYEYRERFQEVILSLSNHNGLFVLKLSSFYKGKSVAVFTRR